MFLFMVSLMNKEIGLTLFELLFVIMIIGVIAALAFPRFLYITEKSHASEGVEVLRSLLAAQRLYAFDNNGNYASSLNSLDVTIPSLSYFNQPNVFNNAAAVATIQRNTGAYTLSISSSGDISCDVPSICSKLGF